MASGVIGDPGFREVTGDETRSIVQNQFDVVRGDTSSLKATIQGILDQILDTSLMNYLYNKIVENLESDDPNLEFPEIDVPLWNIDPPPVPQLRGEFDPIDVDDEVPDIGDFVEREIVYASATMDAQITWLLEQLTEGGTGLGAAVEAEIWDRARSRKDLERQRQFQAVLDRHATLGWMLPAGAMSAELAELQSEWTRADNDLNADIAVKQAELAQANTHFAHDLALKADQFLGNFSLEGKKTDVSVYTARVNMVTAIVQKIKALVEAKAAKNTAIANVYKAEADAVSSIWDAISKAVDVVVKQAIAKAEFYIKKNEMIFENAKEMYVFMRDMIRSWGQIMAQMCAAAQGSAHVSAQLGFSESRQDSSSQQKGRSYSENISDHFSISHQYTHKD